MLGISLASSCAARPRVGNRIENALLAELSYRNTKIVSASLLLFAVLERNVDGYRVEARRVLMPSIDSYTTHSYDLVRLRHWRPKEVHKNTLCFVEICSSDVAAVMFLPEADGGVRGDGKVLT